MEAAATANVFVDGNGDAISAANSTTGKIITYGGTEADGVFTAGALEMFSGEETEVKEGSRIVITDATTQNSVVLSTSTAAITQKEGVMLAADALAESAPEGVTLDLGWTIVVTNDDASSVLVEIDTASGLDLDTLKIYTKTSDENAAWTEADVLENLVYDAANGKLSFTTTNVGSYALAYYNVPEPSAFGLIAGTLALALCAARRRRRCRA